MTPEVWQETLRRLDRKALSRMDLATALRKAGFTAEDTAEAVQKAVELGCCNDFALAGWKASAAASANCGMRKIKEKIRAANVSSEAMEQALAEQAEGEEERALAAAAFKLRCLARETDRRKLREKILRFLLSKGFSMTMAKMALEKVLLQQAEDTFADF